MRLLRAFAGSLLLILAGLVGLVGALLCVTLILIPLGIPLMMLARRLFGFSMTLFLPRAVRHPVQELADSVKPSKRQRKKMGKTAKKAKKKGRKLLARQRKRIA